MPTKEKEPDRILVVGRPEPERCDNTVKSARYTAVTFFPKAVLEQFRRFANLYFLAVGLIMFVGTYTPLYDSAISPWTTLGPLAIVISISLLVEGFSDYKRHLNDAEMNNADCVVLRRINEVEAKEKVERDKTIANGKDVMVNINKAYYNTTSTSVRGLRSRTMTDPNDPGAEIVRIAFQKVKRKDIRQGQIVLVKNREMVPADLLLLASSNDHGGAYIETSSIDGETNLKLRNSPHLPPKILKALREGTLLDIISEGQEEEDMEDEESKLISEFETLDAATKRLTRFSALGRPKAASALEHPAARHHDEAEDVPPAPPTDGRPSSFKDRLSSPLTHRKIRQRRQHQVDEGKYVAVLTTEPPNASVHTFSGKLTLPPYGDGPCHEIPLGAENVLLRGAVIRNTEWVLGLAVFTGKDTKLVQNSFETPSKFSQLDRLMNKTVVFILCLMVAMISYLSTAAVITNEKKFPELFYVGFNANGTQRWPYLPQDIDPPEWDSEPNNWLQNFFLYVTLVSNMIPLSLYVTVEMVQFCMLWLIYVDVEMYDDTTDTRALARSTIVSDLGRIQYIFSDKTGTLTRNVMCFKRCSVDGMAFGAPIQRMRPTGEAAAEDEEQRSSFHPLRQLTVGRFNRPAGLEGLGGSTAGTGGDLSEPDNKLTFHVEMFLRVMSLCHTVVVEKDIENKDHISAGMSTTSSHASSRSLSSYASRLFKSNRRRADTGGSVGPPLTSVAEGVAFDPASLGPGRARTNTAYSLASGEYPETAKNSDGAPMGYAYQAESPDEGALVSAASLTYGFQVIGRDLNGIRLRCSVPSHLQDSRVVEGLKSKQISLDRLAAMTAVDVVDPGESVSGENSFNRRDSGERRDETWTILAINKFDSDRKRMSILLRSPPDLGNLPILFCKGADSSMLDPSISGRNSVLRSGLESQNTSTELSPVVENDNDDDDSDDEVGYGLAHMLGIEVHLGEFAREGLRTLVLGMRVLSEEECSEWLQLYKSAAISLKNRKELLFEAAMKIERDLHILGATAIEDKLQHRVPETIATLEKAGIKLWVLTGDKRETAVEIGYSTHVLTSKMHLTEVADNGRKHVRTQMAMEFIRLVKNGRLPQYQKSALNDSGELTLRQGMKRSLAAFLFKFGKWRRRIRRVFMLCMGTVMSLLGMKHLAERKLEKVAELKIAEKKIMKDIDKRRHVRHRADKTIRVWLEQSEKGRDSVKRVSVDGQNADSMDELSLASEELPVVFNRARSARSLLNDIRGSGKLSKMEMRQFSIAYLTAQQAGDGATHDQCLVDEDTLSLASFVPQASGDLRGEFDKKKRTLLERMFAVDREVRKGRLKKHMKIERLRGLSDENDEQPEESDEQPRQSTRSAKYVDGPRALVIEGHALKHLLGDPEFEEILFAVASNCEAVIACRVSPKQKALLVNLVRRNITPEPITLAIGDGANDVGMIQEAHVGVGISGKEGKQAVNASDFAIAQFRFLETLILIHGRWNFFRLSTVVLFSFYKNAVMAGMIMVYAGRTVYSGTPLFDQWVVSMLNFVAAFPIIFTGLFDRCLSKKYVREHPEVYRATRENELITFRTLIRWILLCLVHVFILYICTVPQQSYGGGITSAFRGLMKTNDQDCPGDGEGGDLSSVGTATFSCLIVLLAYKVLYESRSLVHGRWPAFTCRKGVGEGVWSRLAYTWIGVTYLSILFYFLGIGCYQLLGRQGAGTFSGFTYVTNHVFGTRSMSWLLLAFVPVIGIMFDVVFKVFSNMYFPTQTQIHLEIEAKEKMERKKRTRVERKNSFRRRQANSPAANAELET